MKAAFPFLLARYFVLGFFPWLTLFVFDWSSNGDFLLSLKGAFFGEFQHIMLKGGIAYGLRENIFLVFYQFPHVYLIAIAGGIFLFLKQFTRRYSLHF